MNSRVTFPAERLQVVQCVIAGISGTASSRAAPIEMVNSKIVGGPATLTSEPVSLQRLLPVATEVVVVSGFSEITGKSRLGHVFGGSSCIVRSLRRRTSGATHFWPAVIDVIVSTFDAMITRANDARARFATKLGEVFAVILGANMRRTRGARLLTPASRFIGCAALLADAITVAAPCLSVRFQRTGFASLCVWGVLGHPLAAAGADDGSVGSRSHASYYSGRWGIV